RALGSRACVQARSQNPPLANSLGDGCCWRLSEGSRSSSACLPWTVVPSQQYSELIVDGPARQSVELWKTPMTEASEYPNESGDRHTAASLTEVHFRCSTRATGSKLLAQSLQEDRVAPTTAQHNDCVPRKVCSGVKTRRTHSQRN